MQHKHGFTIIEVVLFLAISGGLAVMLLVGTAGAIQRQQYRDSVESFANFLNVQYSRVISVENDRNNDRSCPLITTEVASRGQSDCVVVGRYVVTADSDDGRRGQLYETYPVYAIKDTDDWIYGIDDTIDTEYSLNWGARTRLANKTDGAVSLLLFRSPENGTMTIRSDDVRHTDINGLISASSPMLTQEICVYDNGWLPGERRSVFIGARASSGDAVTTNNASEGCADV